MQSTSIIFACLFLLTSAHGREELEFDLPFREVSAAIVKRVEIQLIDDDREPVEPSVSVTDKDWISALLKTITEKDYPTDKAEGASFSYPGTICRLRFIDTENEAIVSTSILGAWNLLISSRAGQERGTLGSNRAFTAHVIARLTKLHPEVIAKHKARYRANFSGSYPKEYHEVIGK